MGLFANFLRVVEEDGEVAKSVSGTAVDELESSLETAVEKMKSPDNKIDIDSPAL